MKIYRLAIFVFMLLAFAACENTTDLVKEEFTHDEWTMVLKENVDSLGFVDYVDISRDTNYVKYLRKIVVADTSEMNEKEKLAFFLNAYNAFTIKNVIDKWEIMSPKDAEHFFEEEKFTIADNNFSLNTIEKDVLVPINNTLIYFGLVTASQSSPPLMKEAFTADKVYEQLSNNGKHFLSMENKNKLDKANNTLYLSQIFNWHKTAFEKEYGSVMLAALKFLDEDAKEYIAQNDVEIEYMDYNWNLNMQGPDEKEDKNEK